MRKIRTIIISSGLLFAVAGCTSSGNDFFTFHSSDSNTEVVASSTHAVERAPAPRLAYSVSHGAVLGENGDAASQPERMDSWWRAARSGDHSAQLHLGYLYAMGEGVTQDFVAAYTWLNLAVVNLPPGLAHDRAVANREIVALELRPAEIAAAHRQMSEWAPVGSSAPARTAGDISIEVDFQELGYLDNLDIHLPI